MRTSATASARRRIATSGLDQFVELNAFAVQYRYEPLYFDEESLDRSGLADEIGRLIDQVARAIRRTPTR